MTYRLKPWADSVAHYSPVGEVARFTRLLVHKNNGCWYVRGVYTVPRYRASGTVAGPFDTLVDAYDVAAYYVRRLR